MATVHAASNSRGTAGASGEAVPEGGGRNERWLFCCCGPNAFTELNNFYSKYFNALLAKKINYFMCTNFIYISQTTKLKQNFI